MPMETVPRTWTIATWLLADASSDVEKIAIALDTLEGDAYALQSIKQDDVEEIAAALGLHHAWELSFYPRSRLLPGSGVGLAVLSRHPIMESSSVVINEHSSTFSNQRRVAQFATVNRSDHSGYVIVHSVGASRDVLPRTHQPIVRFRPEQVGVDDAGAVDLPDGATDVRVETTRPIERAAPLMAVTFDLPWVQGDFPIP